MGIKERVKRLENAHYGKPGYHIFIKDPGAPGTDPEGWKPGEQETAENAEAQGDTVHIINVSVRERPTYGS